MEKVLLAVDGSSSSDHATDVLITQYQSGMVMELHLLNVQSPMTGLASSYLADDLPVYYQEMGKAALASACRRLDRAGIPYQTHVTIGHPGEGIVNYARQLGCDRIVVGNRRRGRLTGILLGSISADVVHEAHIPVEVIPIDRAAKAVR